MTLTCVTSQDRTVCVRSNSKLSTSLKTRMASNTKAASKALAMRFSDIPERPRLAPTPARHRAPSAHSQRLLVLPRPDAQSFRSHHQKERRHRDRQACQNTRVVSPAAVGSRERASCHAARPDRSRAFITLKISSTIIFASPSRVFLLLGGEWHGS